MKTKLIKEVIRTSRNELLNKLLQKELKELKRECYKYKKNTGFLDFPVSIEEKDLSTLNDNDIKRVLGLYEEERDKKIKHKLKHKISIDEKALNEYILYPVQSWHKWMGKKYFKKQLIQIIRHELVHSWTNEKMENWIIDNDTIKNTHCDASPFFLMALHRLDGVTHHDCETAFKKSQFYKKVKEFKDKPFRHFEMYLFRLLNEYENIARDLKCIKKDKTAVMNSFVFANANTSFTKRYELEEECSFITKEKKLMKQNIKTIRWEIGATTTPEFIKKTIERKIDTKQNIRNIDQYVKHAFIYNQEEQKQFKHFEMFNKEKILPVKGGR